MKSLKIMMRKMRSFCTPRIKPKKYGGTQIKGDIFIFAPQSVSYTEKLSTCYCKQKYHRLNIYFWLFRFHLSALNRNNICIAFFFETSDSKYPHSRDLIPYFRIHTVPWCYFHLVSSLTILNKRQ